ncbi:MAG TPA: hypothetical protein VKR58_13420, partial [Aquella sp.]|nr:hypothetical protein [Aquella sp.]
TGNTSDFTTCFNSIILDSNKQYEAALLSLDTYNSIPNIIERKNNEFKYYNGESWKTINLNTGAYELNAINNEIKRQIIVNGDSDSAIDINADISTLKSIVNIDNPNYKVDFSAPNSIGSVLGFETIIGHGYNVSLKIVDIIQVNSILVNIDIIMGSYVNGSSSPTIYSFYPNVAPGYKIVERPNPSLIYYPISRQDISRMRVWLTDQKGNLVDFRGETVTVRIHVREVKSRSIESDILKAIKELKLK